MTSGGVKRRSGMARTSASGGVRASGSSRCASMLVVQQCVLRQMFVTSLLAGPALPAQSPQYCSIPPVHCTGTCVPAFIAACLQLKAERQKGAAQRASQVRAWAPAGAPSGKDAYYFDTRWVILCIELMQHGLDKRC